MPPAKRNPPAGAAAARAANNPDDGDVIPAPRQKAAPHVHRHDEVEDMDDDQGLFTRDEVIAQATQVKVLSQYETVLWTLYAEECNEKRRPIMMTTLVMLMKDLGFNVGDGDDTDTDNPDAQAG